MKRLIELNDEEIELIKLVRLKRLHGNDELDLLIYFRLNHLMVSEINRSDVYHSIEFKPISFLIKENELSLDKIICKFKKSLKIKDSNWQTIIEDIVNQYEDYQNITK